MSLGHAELSAYFQLAYAFGVKLSYFQNVPVSQPGTAVLFSMTGIFWPGLPVSIFLNHVGDVVGNRAYEQMIRPNARPIIAFVADDQSRRNGSVMQFPGKSVSDDVFSCDLEAAISASSSNPVIPTGRSFDDMTPEPVLGAAVFPGIGAGAAAETSRALSVETLRLKRDPAVIANGSHKASYHKPELPHSVFGIMA